MKGHIRRRGDKSWAVIVDLGRGPDGKRKQKWHAVHGTKRDAERELARIINSMNTGTYVEPSKTTLAEYLEYWLTNYAKTTVNAKTFERYAEIVQKHLIPALGAHLLSKLKPMHIQTYYTQALNNGRMDGKGGLSAQTVLHHHRILKTALGQAVKWQMLVQNPAAAAEPPRPKKIEMQALDEVQTATLLRALKDKPLYMPVLLAVTTGMRRGEVLGVRWQDIDLKAAELSVQQTLEETKAGLAFKAPKTKKSIRKIALSPMVVEALRKHRAEQNSHKLLMGSAYKDSDLVCTQPDGSPMVPKWLTGSFRWYAGQLAIPKVRFHDLRHTHATQLLRQGVHPKVVSERLGHSTVNITLDTYSHVLPGMQADAALKIDAALQAAFTVNRKS